MNNFPRRSPRFQQPNNQQSSLLPFSATSSTISTAHPSPTNDLIDQPQQYSIHYQSQFLSTPHTFQAPLPSPSATDLGSYMSSAQSQYSQQDMSGQSQQTQSTNFQNNSTQAQSQPQNISHHQQHHSSFSQPQRPSYPPASVNGVPPGLPPDFLAEAAKRAQMACLMRDLGDVSL